MSENILFGSYYKTSITFSIIGLCSFILFIILIILGIPDALAFIPFLVIFMFAFAFFANLIRIIFVSLDATRMKTKIGKNLYGNLKGWLIAKIIITLISITLFGIWIGYYLKFENYLVGKLGNIWGLPDFIGSITWFKNSDFISILATYAGVPTTLCSTLFVITSLVGIFEYSSNIFIQKNARTQRAKYNIKMVEIKKELNKNNIINEKIQKKNDVNPKDEANQNEIFSRLAEQIKNIDAQRNETNNSQDK